MRVCVTLQNREARLRAKREETEAEAAAVASNVRVNPKSHELLRAKADRRVRSLFDLLDREARGVLHQSDLAVAFEGLVRRLRERGGKAKGKEAADRDRGRGKDRDRDRENQRNAHNSSGGGGVGVGRGSDSDGPGVEMAVEAMLRCCDAFWAKLDSDQVRALASYFVV